MFYLSGEKKGCQLFWRPLHKQVICVKKRFPTLVSVAKCYCTLCTTDMSHGRESSAECLRRDPEALGGAKAHAGVYKWEWTAWPFAGTASWATADSDLPPVTFNQRSHSSFLRWGVGPYTPPKKQLKIRFIFWHLKKNKKTKTKNTRKFQPQVMNSFAVVGYMERTITFVCVGIRSSPYLSTDSLYNWKN